MIILGLLFLIFSLVQTSPRPRSIKTRNFNEYFLSYETVRISNRIYYEFKQNQCANPPQFFCPIMDFLFGIYCQFAEDNRTKEETWKQIATHVIRNEMGHQVVKSEDKKEFYKLVNRVLLRRTFDVGFPKLLHLCNDNEVYAYIYVASMVVEDSIHQN